MKITRFTQDTINKNILKSVECEECRNKIETYDIYTIGLSINKKDRTEKECYYVEIVLEN